MYLFLKDLLKARVSCCPIFVEVLLSIDKGSQEKQKIGLLLCAKLEKGFEWPISWISRLCERSSCDHHRKAALTCRTKPDQVQIGVP